MGKELKSLKRKSFKKSLKKVRGRTKVKRKGSRLKFRLYRNKQFVKFTAI